MLDLRQFTAWCQLQHLRLFQVRRADIECFARGMEARGRARATITRRLCTVAGFYRYAVVRREALVRREAPLTEGGGSPPRWVVAATRQELSAA